MSEPFLGELKLVGFAFAPRNWADCNGQLLPINSYQSLFSLLGTTYGGDGRTTFGLPDLRGRVAAHEGPDLRLGQKLGQETVTLTPAHLPPHTHVLRASSAAATAAVVTGMTHAAVDAGTVGDRYGPATELVDMAPGHLAATAAQPHENRQPYQVVRWVIALTGIFPSRN